MSKGQVNMVAKDVSISVRINSSLRNEAEEIFKKMGLSLSEAVCLFIEATVNAGSLPFELEDSLKDEVRRKANATLRKEIQKGLEQ